MNYILAKRLRAFCMLGVVLAISGCQAVPIALLSTIGGIGAQALHLDTALVELWTTYKQQKAAEPNTPQVKPAAPDPSIASSGSLP